MEVSGLSGDSICIREHLVGGSCIGHFAIGSDLANEPFNGPAIAVFCERAECSGERCLDFYWNWDLDTENPQECMRHYCFQCDTPIDA